jgi:hypothetical protein
MPCTEAAVLLQESADEAGLKKDRKHPFIVWFQTSPRGVMGCGTFQTRFVQSWRWFQTSPRGVMGCGTVCCATRMSPLVPDLPLWRNIAALRL